MNKLGAAVALACVFAAPAAASPPSVAASPLSIQRAEALARDAVAPLAVESAVCVTQSRRRVVCFLAHPDADGRECRSAVLVRTRQVRIVQSNICFEFRKVAP